MLAFGAALFAAAIAPPALRAATAGRAARLAAMAAPLALLATLFRLPAQAAALGDGWGDAVDPGLLATVATGTAVGRAWCVQAAAALLLAGLALRPRPATRMAPRAVAAGLALGSLALSGHAAAAPGWRGALAALALATHLLAGGAWIGGLPEVIRLMAAPAPARDAGAAAQALRRFSAAGHGFVAAMIAAGALAALLILGRPGDVLRSAYGGVLVSKLLLAAAMAGLALLNRYRLVRRLGADPRARPRLLATTRSVLALGLAAVAASGLLGLLEPP